MDRATIARIEGGSRTVSIDDAFVIAAALDVSPIHLLTPTTGEQDMHPAPTTTRSPAQARRWVLATRPLPGQDEVTFRHEEDLHQVTETEWALGPLSEEDRQVVEAAARSAHDFMLNELDRAMRTRQQRDAHAHDTENTEG
jgi:transcriptional regulator with XRE-family HTH domain